jgi:hypothetical protein
MPAATRRYFPFLAIILYVFYAAWLISPALGNLGTAVPGSDGDAFVHLWTYDWTRDALINGQSPFFTTRLFYPNGVFLYTHNFAWLNIALWLPLQAAIGEAAAYTITFWLVFVLNGTAVFFLVRHLVQSDLAALVAGFIATGWPYLISRTSQPNLIFIACLPLALLALHRLTLSRRWKDALWLGLAVAGLGLSRFQLLIMSLPILVAAALAWLWAMPHGARRQALVQMGAAAVLAGLLLAPVAGPVLWFQATREYTADILPDEDLWGEADLLGFFLPGTAAPGGTAATQALPNVLTRTPIGYVTLLLTLLGLFTPRRDKWLWLGLALLIGVLALGRELTINGRVVALLPYAWLEQHISLVALIRYPSRYSALLVVPMAVLAGYGVTWLEARLNHTTVAVTAVILLLFIAIEDQVGSYPMLPLETPAWYSRISAQPEEYGLVTVPLSRGFDEYAMTYQLTGNKPLVEGHVSRPPREAFLFIDSTPFLNALRERVTTPPPEMQDVAVQLHPLAEANLPYIVIHKPFVTPAESSAWRLWFGIPPYYEDGEVLVYPTAVRAGESFTAQPTGLPGIAFVSGQMLPGTVAPGEPVVTLVHWALDAGLSGDRKACLNLAGDASVSYEHCLPLALPFPAEGKGRLARTEQPFSFDPPLSDGRYEAGIILRSADGQQSALLPLGTLVVSAGGRQFTPPEMENDLEVAFGDSMALLGFDGPQIANDALDITLFWQSTQEMSISYKLFLHLIDTASGELVAQLDTVPRDWAYPTNTWHKNEVVSDRLRLPLHDLPPGDYALRLGVYHPDSGARLPLSSAAGLDTTDDSLLLTVINP